MVVAVAAGIAAPAARLSFGDLPRMLLFLLRRKDNPVLLQTCAVALRWVPEGGSGLVRPDDSAKQDM